jgi:phospholipase/lecithinase/hemolysin
MNTSTLDVLQNGSKTNDASLEFSIKRASQGPLKGHLSSTKKGAPGQNLPLTDRLKPLANGDATKSCGLASSIFESDDSHATLAQFHDNIAVLGACANDFQGLYFDDGKIKHENRFVRAVSNYFSPDDRRNISNLSTLGEQIGTVLQTVATGNISEPAAKQLALELQAAVVGAINMKVHYNNKYTGDKLACYLKEIDTVIGALQMLQVQINARFPAPRHAKQQFSSVIYQGDSLTDKGNFKQSHPLISHAAPTLGINMGAEDRFTNMYNWADFLDAHLASKAVIHNYAKGGNQQDKNRLADFIITHPAAQEFNVNADASCRFRGVPLTRNLAQGGATAGSTAQWSQKIANRFILDNIDAQRQMLFQQHDMELDKALYIEWSGANDLATINTPNVTSAAEAVASRMQNMRNIIASGGKIGLLFNLPDLSETPRYRNQEPAIKSNAKFCTQYYNELLKLEVDKLKAELKVTNPDVRVELFDVNSVVSACLGNLASIGFSDQYQFQLAKPGEEPVLSKNKIVLTLEPHTQRISYKVLDPCGQPRHGTVSPELHQQIEVQLLDAEAGQDTQLDTFLLSSAAAQKLIRHQIEQDGHIVDMFTPINATQGYKTLLAEQGTIAILPGNNQLFWDDVHPSSHLQNVIAKKFVELFLEENYEFIPPSVASTNKKMALSNSHIL